MFSKAFKSVTKTKAWHGDDQHSTRTVSVRWLCPLEYTFRKLKDDL